MGWKHIIATSLFTKGTFSKEREFFYTLSLKLKSYFAKVLRTFHFLCLLHLYKCKNARMPTMVNNSFPPSSFVDFSAINVPNSMKTFARTPDKLPAASPFYILFVWKWVERWIKTWQVSFVCFFFEGLFIRLSLSNELVILGPFYCSEEHSRIVITLLIFWLFGVFGPVFWVGNIDLSIFVYILFLLSIDMPIAS